MPTSLKLAAALFIVTGLGFGVRAFQVAPYALRHQDLPVWMGIRAFSGPFERFGWSTFAALLVIFGVLSLLEVLAGVLIWRGLKLGAILGLVLSAANLIFWIGFFLPGALLAGPVRVILVILGWNQFR